MSSLLGRLDEQKRVRRALGETSDGAKRAILFAGAPGIGKTALLLWTFKAAAAHGPTALIRAPLASLPAIGFPVRHLLEGFADWIKRNHEDVPSALVDELDSVSDGRPADLFRLTRGARDGFRGSLPKRVVR